MKAQLKGFVKRTAEKDTPQKDQVRRETVKFICSHFINLKHLEKGRVLGESGSYLGEVSKVINNYQIF